MQPHELDDAYTRLCYALTEAGEAYTPLILARLALLLMQEVGDADRVERAIDSALEGYR